ncbi:MAG: tRNA (guanosine(46)-N7)-methyltransferase TrmB [Bacilli bacterium]|nr:tRNA (guanosine(46)-N7)-methyltransferase TrmB [Bacilli bacterium]
MRTKFKAWAEPYINEHPEVSLTSDEIKKLDDFYLEIGSGKGDFLVKMASKNPDKFFLGIEKNVTCAGFSYKKLVESELPNAKLIWQDVMNIFENIKDKSVNVVFLNFSDPWPKRRHYKRRLTSELFLEQYRRILKDDGILVFKSDNEDLFEYSIEMFLQHGYNIFDRNDNYQGEDTFDAKTEYEQWFNERDIPIHRVKVKKA